MIDECYQGDGMTMNVIRDCKDRDSDMMMVKFVIRDIFDRIDFRIWLGGRSMMDVDYQGYCDDSRIWL